MAEKSVREHDKFMLRLPDGMRDELKHWAQANKRSLNAEIVARLAASLPNDDQLLEGLGHASVAGMLEEHQKKLDATAARIEELFRRLEARVSESQ